MRIRLRVANLVLLLAALLSGCETLVVYPQHPSVRFRDKALHMPEALRAGVHAVTVVPLQRPSVVQASGPDYGKQGGEVGQGAKQGVGAAVETSLSEPLGVVLLPLLLPVMAGAGAAAGAVTAQQRENKKEATDELLALHGRALPNEELARATAELVDATRRYQLVDAQAADVELAVGVDLIEAFIEQNTATITIHVDASIAVLPAHSALYERSFVYEKTLPLKDWTADGGEELAMYLDSARHRVAQQLVDSILTRVEIRHVLRPIATSDYSAENRSRVGSLTPRLAWEFVPLGSDDHLPAPVSVNPDSVTYDLEIYDDERLIYRRRGLTSPSHQTEAELEPCRTLSWSVRPAFETGAGLARVGEWMQRSPGLMDNSQSLATEIDGQEVVLPVSRFLTLRSPCRAGT